MRKLQLILLAGVFGVAMRASADQSSTQQATTSVPASPTVLVSVMARGASSMGEADLLTFWRGSPDGFRGRNAPAVEGRQRTEPKR